MSAASWKPADDVADAILSGLAWIGLLGILVVGVMMQQLQALLTGMHTDGNPAAAAAFRHPTTGTATIHDWFTYAARANTLLGLEIDGAGAAPVTSPRQIVALHSWLDSYFLVPAYLLLLIGLLLLARHRIKSVGGAWGKVWRDRGSRQRIRQSVTKGLVLPQVLFVIGIVTVIVGALADIVVENRLEVRAMDEAARIFDADPTVGVKALEQEIGPFLSQIRVFALIKMIAIGIAMLCTLLLWIIRSADERGRTSGVWRSVVAIRAQIVVVVVLSFVVSRQEAALDAIRGWGPVQAAWTIGLTLLLAYVSWETCRRLIAMLQSRAKDTAPSVHDTVLTATGEPAEPRRAIAKGAIAGVLLILGWILGWRGLFIPAGFVGASALGDLMAPPRVAAPAPADRGENGKRDLGKPWPGLAFVIAAAVSIMVGLGMIGASFGQLVYQPNVDPGRLQAIASGGVALATLPAVVALIVGLHFRGTERSWRWLGYVIGTGASAMVGLVMILVAFGELLYGSDARAARLLAIAGGGAALVIVPVIGAVILGTRDRPPKPSRRSLRSADESPRKNTICLNVPKWANPDPLFALIYRRERKPPKTLEIPIFFGLVVAGIVLSFALVLPMWSALAGHAWWELPETSGPIAVLLSFGVAAMLFVSLLSWLAEKLTPGRALRVLGARRMPFYVLGIAWLLLISLVDSPGFHDVRLLEPPSPPAVQSVALDDAFALWLQDNEADATSDSATRSVTPMLFVASSGGGIRAAYWSALALSCINESEPLSFAATSTSLPPDHSVCASARVIAELRSDAAAGTAETELAAIRERATTRARATFAMSGISGGSLGVAAYAAHLVEALDDPSQLDDAFWLNRRLTDDYLSATMAWALFIELPRAFLRFDVGTDRAEAMEQAWERSWVPVGEPTDGVGLDVGLRELWLEHGAELPLLLLNSTSVADGCRFNGSVVNAGLEQAADRCHSLRSFALLGQDRTDGSQALASTLDLADFLCSDEDVRLSTAVLMSARFPGISPTGRFEACEPDGTGRTVVEPNDSDEPRAVTYLVDGGYLDTSGASALTDVTEALAPLIEDVNEEHAGSCVVPFYVQLDNGHQKVAPPPSDPAPSELRAPLTATNATRGARAASAEATTALAFSRWFSTAGKRLMSGGWPLADRYGWIVPEAHPGVQAPLGWTMSPSAVEDLRTQMRQPLNALTLQEIRRWFAGGMTCSPVVAGERYVPRAFPSEVELGLETVGGRWIVTDTPTMVSGFTELDEGMRGSLTVIPRIENLSEWMLEACRRIQEDETSGLSSCAGATEETKPSFTLAPIRYVRAFLDVPGGGSIELGTPGDGSGMVLATNLGEVTLVAAVSDAAGRPLEARVEALLSIGSRIA